MKQVILKETEYIGEKKDLFMVNSLLKDVGKHIVTCIKTKRYEALPYETARNGLPYDKAVLEWIEALVERYDEGLVTASEIARALFRHYYKEEN